MFLRGAIVEACRIGSVSTRPCWSTPSDTAPARWPSASFYTCCSSTGAAPPPDAASSRASLPDSHSSGMSALSSAWQAPAAGDPLADGIVAASFSGSPKRCSPLCLLHISLRSRPRYLWISGYVISALAVALHIGDVITGAPRFHYAAILLITIGFALLTALSILHRTLSAAQAIPWWRKTTRRGHGPVPLRHLLRAFQAKRMTSKHGPAKRLCITREFRSLSLCCCWDYRFLLLDAFIRFLVNGLLAAFAAWGFFEADAKDRTQRPFPQPRRNRYALHRLLSRPEPLRIRSRSAAKISHTRSLSSLASGRHRRAPA